MLHLFRHPLTHVHRWTPALLAILCTSLVGCEDALTCTADSVETIAGNVRDEAGNPLPVYDVQVKVGRLTLRGCYGSLGSFSCRDVPAGKATVTAQVVDGQELSGSVELSWAPGQEGCRASHAELDLVKPGPGCPALGSLTERSAVRGSVHDALGAPASVFSAKIKPVGGEAWPLPASGGTEPCAIEENRFDCPAVTPYSQLYEVSMNVDGASLTREIYVPASKCEIDVQSVELVSDDGCPEQRADAIEVAISRADGKDSGGGFSVGEVRATWEDAPSYLCTFNGRNEVEDLYRCAGRGLTGAGHYAVVVSILSEKFKHEVEVSADGCQPETQRIDVKVR